MKYIELTQGKKTIVDDEDFDWLNQWKWNYDYGYVKRLYWVKGERGKTIKIYMHRLVIANWLRKTFTGYNHVDHIDGNGLNNRRNNLRIATQQQNNMNTKKRKNCSSIYKGVHWDKLTKKWRVEIAHNKKRFRLGRFNTERQAAMVYDIWANDLFGEYAKINFKVVSIGKGNELLKIS